MDSLLKTVRLTATCLFFTIVSNVSSYAQVGGPVQIMSNAAGESILGIESGALMSTQEVGPNEFIASYLTPVYCNDVDVTYLGVQLDAQSAGGGELIIGLYLGSTLVYQTAAIPVTGGVDELVGQAVLPGSITMDHAYAYRIGFIYSGPDVIFVKTSTNPVNVGLTQCSSPLGFFDVSTTYPDLPDPFSISGAWSENIGFNINGIVNTFNSYASIAETACGSYTSPSGAHTWTTSGTYYDTLQNATGCDSILIIDLTMNPTTYATQTVIECGEYTWVDGNTYAESVQGPTHTYYTQQGCPYEVMLNLTVLEETAYTDVVTSNGPYTWMDGNTYTASNNTATYLTTNAAGCDSVISLDLTVQSLGIQEAGDLGVQVYPNPAKDIANIVFDVAQRREYVLTNTEGRVVQVGTFENSDNTIDVHQLSAGVYTLSMSDLRGALRILKQ